MDASPSTNPYLAGNFAPVRSEDDFELEVVGEFPSDLRGVFYRNGPNPQFEPRGHYHWFTGDGMIHAFFVEDGKVAYRNRYVRTPKWELEHAAGKALFGGFDPRAADPSVMGKDSGVANTNIVWHAGRLLALEEGHKPFELDPASLESRGYVEPYGGRVTAHPKIDPETGEMVWFGYSVGAGWFTKTMSYGVTDAKGRVTRRDNFEAPFSSMVHDFLVTRRHALFPDPAADRRPSARDARRPGFRLGAGQGLAHRRDGARRRRREHALVHDRGLLRLPSDERLGRGRHDFRRRDGVPGRAALSERGRFDAGARRPRGSCAGPSTSPERRTRSSGSRSTICRASFRASTSGARAWAIGTAGSPDAPAGVRRAGSTASPTST